MKTVSELIRKIAYTCPYWENRIRDRFGIELTTKEQDREVDPILARQIYQILDLMPEKLVRDSGIKHLYLSNTMGPNLPKYPNHGYYVGDLVTLNEDIFYSPDEPEDFFDSHGYFISRPAETLTHEIGHAYDAAKGDLSTKPEWLRLSGWSKDAKSGLKRLLINDPGAPVVIGEWYFDPKAKFTRFYAKRNPWDDFADSFAFYIGNMKDKVPEKKRAYFDDLLKIYFR